MTLRVSVLYIRINLVQFYPPRNGIEQGLHTWLPYIIGIVVYSHLMFLRGVDGLLLPIGG